MNAALQGYKPMFGDQKSSLEKNVEILMTDVAEIKAEQRGWRP